MHEQKRYLGLLQEHGTWQVVKGCSPDEILENLKPRIKILREKYPDFNWKGALTVIGIGESFSLDSFWDEVEKEEKEESSKSISTTIS